MNRETILNLKPGSEMDALVAEKVMGWREDESSDAVFGFEGCCEGFTHWRDDDGDPAFLREYSTDLTAAFEIIYNITHKAEREGCGPCVRIEHDGRWHVKIGYIQAVADKLPEAICKTALFRKMED